MNIKKITLVLLMTFLLGLGLFISSCTLTHEACEGCDEMGLPISEITIPQMLDGYHTHRFTVDQIVETYLTRINALNKKDSTELKYFDQQSILMVEAKGSPAWKADLVSIKQSFIKSGI